MQYATNTLLPELHSTKAVVPC